VQLDEKWAFVGKKQKHCVGDEPPEGPRPNDAPRPDDHQGDCWDHVALDPESKLVLSVVPGKRTAANTVALVQDVKKRLGNKPPTLVTTDEYPPYRDAILDTFGDTVVPPPTGRPGRPQSPYKIPPAQLNYATVHKTREKGRVVKIDYRVVFGTWEAVRAALAASTASTHINTSFIERHHGTDRHRNARKARDTYRFSKEWEMHEAVTYLTMFSYNFCWPVRTLTTTDAHGRRHPRTPAMAAGLTDHVWTLIQWLRYPALQST
jgi:IS1 family transposase